MKYTYNISVFVTNVFNWSHTTSTLNNMFYFDLTVLSKIYFPTLQTVYTVFTIYISKYDCIKILETITNVFLPKSC